MDEGGSVQPLEHDRSTLVSPRATRVLAVLVVAAGLAIAFTGCAYSASARPACADAVLDDWSKGRLGDVAHPPDCYAAAIDALPEDLRSYTTAADDISRAAMVANRSTRELASTPAEADSVRAFPLEVALLGCVVGVLAVGGLTAALIRRRRAR